MAFQITASLWIYDAAMFFKSIEWVFLAWLIVCILHLFFTRFFFNAMISFANWLIRWHRFDGGIASTDEAYVRFRRDLWLMAVLLLMILVLLRWV